MRQLSKTLCAAIVFASLLSACASSPMQMPPASQLRDVASLHARGLETIITLYTYYNSVATDCGGPGLPAVLCSGVPLRATENVPNGTPWEPSDSAIESGGVSFSWLRQDLNFSLLPINRTNGFFFYPKLRTPPGKNGGIDVLCAFPNDGLTTYRDAQGCGESLLAPPDVSRPCEVQGITTAAQWFVLWEAAADKFSETCGFNIRESAQNQADRFRQVILAKTMFPDWAWVTWNELRLATWQPGSGATLPIIAFFYEEGSEAGLAGSRHDQQKYFALCAGDSHRSSGIAAVQGRSRPVFVQR